MSSDLSDAVPTGAAAACDAIGARMLAGRLHEGGAGSTISKSSEAGRGSHDGAADHRNVLVCPVGLALALAILVNAKVKGVTAFRTVIFMPVVTSMVVVSILWSFFYEDDGLFNSALNTITGGAWTAVAWLNNPGTAMPAIILLSIWQAVGLHMIIWLSGLQGIDPALYEAADLDGASGWQRFRYVTWPGLRSTMVFILVTITIAALGLFVQVDVMTSGGPQDATSTLVYHAVRKGYREQDMGYGSAISLIFFLAVLAISLIQRRLTREKD